MTEVKKRIIDSNEVEISSIKEEDEFKLKEEKIEEEERNIWDYFSHYPYISTIFFF